MRWEFWKNFLRERLRVVSNYEQAKFTRKARGANNFRRCSRFAFLLIFAERVDFSCCYFSPKLKITRTLGTTVQKGLTLLARWQPLPPSQKKFVPREKDSSDPNGRFHHPEEKRSNHFVRSTSSLKRATFFPGRPITSLSGRKNQPRLIHKTSTLVIYQDEGKQLTKGPVSFPGFFSVEGRRAGKDFKREIKDLSAVKGFFSHYTSHDLHSSGVTASVEAAKISVLHPPFLGVWNSRDQPRRWKALGTMLP